MIVLYSRDDEGVGIACDKISPKTCLDSPQDDMTVLIGQNLAIKCLRLNVFVKLLQNFLPVSVYSRAVGGTFPLKISNSPAKIVSDYYIIVRHQDQGN